MKSYFLSCNGFFNTVILEKKLLQKGAGLDLLIDGKFACTLTASHTKKQPPLTHINQIVDAGFDQGVANWHYDPMLPHGASLGLDMSEKWTLFNGHTLHIHQNAGFNSFVDLLYHDPVVGDFLPVKPDEFYQLTGSFGLHRCHGVYLAEFYDENYRLLSRDDKNVVQGKRGGGRYWKITKPFQPLSKPQKMPFSPGSW